MYILRALITQEKPINTHAATEIYTSKKQIRERISNLFMNNIKSAFISVQKHIHAANTSSPTHTSKITMQTLFGRLIKVDKRVMTDMEYENHLHLPVNGEYTSISGSSLADKTTLIRLATNE